MIGWIRDFLEFCGLIGEEAYWPVPNPKSQPLRGYLMDDGLLFSRPLSEDELTVLCIASQAPKEWNQR